MNAYRQQARLIAQPICSSLGPKARDSSFCFSFAYMPQRPGPLGGYAPQTPTPGQPSASWPWPRPWPNGPWSGPGPWTLAWATAVAGWPGETKFDCVFATKSRSSFPRFLGTLKYNDLPKWGAFRCKVRRGRSSIMTAVERNSRSIPKRKRKFGTRTHFILHFKGTPE